MLIKFFFYNNWPQSLINTVAVVLPSADPYPSIFLITSIPSTTCPNTTCLPSNHGHPTEVTKNCEPFELTPAFAFEFQN